MAAHNAQLEELRKGVAEAQAAAAATKANPDCKLLYAPHYDGSFKYHRPRVAAFLVG